MGCSRTFCMHPNRKCMVNSAAGRKVHIWVGCVQEAAVHEVFTHEEDITSVQPGEADEMGDLDADITV